MKKLIALFAILISLASNSNAQCPSPTFTWQANKNAFVIPGVPFTGDSLLVRWQIGTTNLWGSKQGKLHAMSTNTRCPNVNNCNYGVNFVKVIYTSQIGYGLIDGGQVQVAIKCGGTWIYSNIENVGTLK